jgi:hypothetical protein
MTRSVSTIVAVIGLMTPAAAVHTEVGGSKGIQLTSLTTGAGLGGAGVGLGGSGFPGGQGGFPGSGFGSGFPPRTPGNGGGRSGDERGGVSDAVR